MALKDQKDVLIAWINGETMQVQNSNGTWSDCCELHQVNTVRLDEYTYRIKSKEIVTTTRIERDPFNAGSHITYSSGVKTKNLRLTWSEDGNTLVKAEVI